LFGTAAGSPGYSSRDRDLPGWAAVLREQLFGMAAVYPWIQQREWVCRTNTYIAITVYSHKLGICLGCLTCSGTIVRKPSPADPGVPAAHEQLFGQVPWRAAQKKRAGKPKPALFTFNN